MTDVRGTVRRAAMVLTALLLVGCAVDEQPLFPKIVNVGAAPSSPGWGMQDPAGNRSGFDYDLTNWLGEQLGFTPVSVNVLAKDREDGLQRGTVSLVVATYSINDERQAEVEFAGPYMFTQQGIMVRVEDKDLYHTVADLNGKTVCVTSGSTSSVQLRAELGFPVSVVEKDVYEQCRQALHAQQVDALSTDQLLLFGLQKIDSEVAVPPDIVFGQQERYGIGLPKGDKAKCEVVTRKLAQFIASGLWDTFFRNNLPNVPVAGHKPDPNRLNSC